MPHGRGSERVDGVGQAERNRHLAETRVVRRPVEIAEQHIGAPHLNLVAFQRRVGSRAEALFRVEQHLRVTREPVAERAGGAQLRRMDRRLRNRVPDLIAGGRVAHQVSELVVAVARLMVGDRGDRPVHVQSVGSEGPVLPAIEYEALLPVDVRRGVQNCIAEFRIETDKSRGGVAGCRGGGPRRLLLPGRLLRLRTVRLQRVDFLPELAIFVFEPVKTFDQGIQRLCMSRTRNQDRQPCESQTHKESRTLPAAMPIRRIWRPLAARPHSPPIHETFHIHP